MSDSTPLPLGLNLDHNVVKATVVSFLDSREYPKTICPSEPARALPADQLVKLENGWRDAMHLIRTILFDMRDRGEVEILQKGQVLPIETTTSVEDIVGPIRARRPSDFRSTTSTTSSY